MDSKESSLSKPGKKTWEENLGTRKNRGERLSPYYSPRIISVLFHEGCCSAWLHLLQKSFLVLNGSSSLRFSIRVTVTARSVFNECLQLMPA